jgi:hypothetical protein
MASVGRSSYAGQQHCPCEEIRHLEIGNNASSTIPIDMVQCTMTSNLQPPDYSKILKEASGGRANLISIFDDSFAAALAVLLARFRKFFRNRHLDISIPRTFIVLVFVTVAWSMIVNSNNFKDCSTSANQAAKIEPYKNYDLIKDLGAFAGATITVLFAMTNMHREYHYKKREKASQYISDWRSFDNSSIRKTVNTLKSELFWDKHPTRFNPGIFDICHSAVAEYKRNADGVEMLQQVQSDILERLCGKHMNNDEKHSVDSILSFFEHMGLDVKNHVADSDYLKDYFYAIVVDTYELFRKYIEHAQIDRSSRITYCNLVLLAQTWEKEGNLPELPRMCLRPPVITSDDLMKVFEHKKNSYR